MLVQQQNPPPAPFQAPEEQTATMKKLKMNTPTPFSGDRKKLDDFLMECNMFL